jgi:hypothetical protein
MSLYDALGPHRMRGNGAGDRRRVGALLAVETQPRRGAVQIAERGGGTSGLHLR